MSLALTSKLASSRCSKVALPLALTMTLGCWSEVEYKEPEKTKVEQPEEDAPSAAPTETDPPTTNDLPTTEHESAPVAEGTPPAEAEPSAASPTSPPSDSPTFEEWLSADESPADDAPSSEAPPTTDVPTQPPSTPSVGDRYAPTTPPAITDPPVKSEADSPPVGDRYAPTSPPPEETTPSPSAESPTTTESTRTLLPWDLPEEVPAAETPEEEAADPASSEPTTPEATEPSEAPSAETPPLEVTPSPVVESPEEQPAPVPEPSSIAFSPDEPEATSADPPPQPFDPKNTRDLAWLLGSKWSLWLLSQHAGAPASEQEKFMQESQSVAKALGVELPKTSPSSPSRPTAALLESILSSGRELGTSIGKAHGTEEMALFEASMKSNLLLVLADSRPDLIPAVLRAVSDAAQRANLPKDALETFKSAITESPKPPHVDQAVFDFHRTVDQSLRTSSDTP